MDFFLLNQVSTFSIIVPAMIGLARYHSILPLYRPFFLLLWIGIFNEALSIVLIYAFNNNVINSNIYVFVEYLLLLLIFYRWNGLMNTNRYYFLLLSGLVVWVLDNLWIHSIHTINSIFRVFYSIVVLFVSISHINKLIVFEKKRLVTNPVFLICTGFVIYYSYKAFIETFYILQLPFSNLFYLHLFQVLLFVNLFTNLVYAIAVICMPTKRAYYLPY